MDFAQVSADRPPAWSGRARGNLRNHGRTGIFICLFCMPDFDPFESVEPMIVTPSLLSGLGNDALVSILSIHFNLL